MMLRNDGCKLAQVSILYTSSCKAITTYWLRIGLDTGE